MQAKDGLAAAAALSERHAMAGDTAGNNGGCSWAVLLLEPADGNDAIIPQQTCIQWMGGGRRLCASIFPSWFVGCLAAGVRQRLFLYLQ